MRYLFMPPCGVRSRPTPYSRLSFYCAPLKLRAIKKERSYSRTPAARSLRAGLRYVSLRYTPYSVLFTTGGKYKQPKTK